MLLQSRTPDGALSALRLLSARDGTALWERSLPAGVDTVQIQADDGVAARVVTAGPGGEMTVLRYADGTTLATARVPWTPNSPSTGAGSMVTTATGLVIALDVTDRGSTVTAYRADTLEPLWDRKFPQWAHAQECGSSVCVGDGNLFTAVDPVTGEPRWTGDGSPFSGVLVGTDRLLLTSNDDGPTQQVVEAATGRPTGAVGRGQLVYRDDRTGALILMRELFPDVNRMTISRLDPVTGRSILLGTVPLANERICGGEAHHLVCQRGDRLTVTAIG